jgi:bifunctional non-homologous end joining protein LigD
MPFQRKKPAAIGVKAPFPGFIEPLLATAIEKVPTGARWIHEIKFDGYRVQLQIANSDVKVFTRRGHDWIRPSSELPTQHFRSAPPPRSSTAKSLCPRPMAPPTSRCCRTN